MTHTSLQQLSPNLYRFRDTCNVYVLRTHDEAVLIDFGAGDVLDALPDIGVSRVTDVLMTHHHRDQGQGLSRAVAAGVRIWVPEVEQELFTGVDVHWQRRAVYNNYNVRQDRFSLLEPVPIAGVLRDYETRQFGSHAMTIVPTPGHTTGSISLLTEIDGWLIAFTGDLIGGPGKVWSLAATQWTYNGSEGLPYTVLSLLDLRDRQLDMLLPSHGKAMSDVPGAIDPLVDRLRELMGLRGQNRRLFELREHPFTAITPHVLGNRTSLANSYVLLSDSGKALFIDFGYDFMAGQAAGDDRASRRPWLYNLATLKRDFGVTQVEVVLPTHYHDDHVAGFNLLRAVEGTEVWAAETFGDVLERPAAYDLTCLWYDPIPVDRCLPAGRPVRWQEYELTMYPLPGHTKYEVAVVFEADGRRMMASGDQLQGNMGLELNYVYQNGFQPGDYLAAAELYRRVHPDIILSGHWDPLTVTDAYLAEIDERARTLERLHRELEPEAPNFNGAPFVAQISPYQAEANAGVPVEFQAEVRNPFNEAAEAVVEVIAPRGWTSTPPRPVFVRSGSPPGTVWIGPRQSCTVRFAVTPPAGAPVRRARIAVDVTVGGWRFGQQAEALVSAVFSQPHLQGESSLQGIVAS